MGIYNINGVEIITGGAESDYKNADKSTWVFTISPDTEGITVLEDTRIYALAEQTVSGCTTYLIPNSVVEQYGAFTKLTGSIYWAGFYTVSGSTRTYTVQSGAWYKDTTYTGVAFCLGNSLTLDSVTFFNSLSVITKITTPVDLPGFSGYEMDDDTFSFEKGSNTYLMKFLIPVENHRVYAINIAQYSYMRMWACRDSTNGFTAESNASYAQMGDYYIIGAIDGYITFLCELSKIAEALYASNGIELYVLDKPWEVQNLADTVPCKALVHGGNFWHKMLLAYALGWKGAEVDVAKTSDGVLVTSHEGTIGGMTIAENTYADLKANWPPLMTVEESIELAAYFGGTIEFDFHHGYGEMTADEKWDCLHKGIKAGIDHIGYYTGDGGYIGSVSADTFYENGLCYGYGDGNDIPSTIFAAGHYIVGYNQDKIDQYPQYAYTLRCSARDCDLTNDYLRTTDKDNFSTINYLRKHWPIYDASCSDITLSATNLTFTSSSTKKLYPTVEPIYCSDVISWASSDTSIATITSNTDARTLYSYATITPVTNGTCTITATCGEKMAMCEITVSGL